MNKNNLSKKLILNGNEALAYGMINANLDFFAGYPITPSTDILEKLSYELEKNNGTFIQAESEISAINMIFGASSVGGRAMTATSGCGFSLMQETISYMAADDIPCVIVNVMREGAGLGDIPPSQGDYFQMTKGGGNGDYHCIVLAPNSVKECYEFPNIAFNLAEKYLTPVIITYDSDIAHIKENIMIDKENNNYNKIITSSNKKKLINNYSQGDNYINSKRIILNGCKNGNKHKTIQNVYYHTKNNYDIYLKNKYKQIETNEQLYETYNIEDANIVFVAYGICSRIAKEVVEILRYYKIKAGLIRPITLYPFPKSAFNTLKKIKKIFVLELDILEQLTSDVKLFTKYKFDIEKIGKMSSIDSAKDIANYILNTYNKNLNYTNIKI